MSKIAEKVSLFIVIIIVFVLILPGSSPPVQANPPGQGPLSPKITLLHKLNQSTKGALRVSYHHETGLVRFIGASPDQAIQQPARLAANASPEKGARGFLATYGPLFGLGDQARELTLMQTRSLDTNRSLVRFQQVHQTIPVIGGELIVQVDRANDILLATGELWPDLKLNITPGVDAATARQTALAKVSKVHNISPGELTAGEPELWIYNPGLLGAPGLPGSTLVWRMEVTAVKLLPVRELVLVDAHLGSVRLNFNQIHTAKNRLVYDNNNDPALGLPGAGPVRSEGSALTGIADVDLAYLYAGDTYDFFSAEHDRDSLDGAGYTLISTTRYCPSSANCPFANAFWNGTQMAYGEGYAAADDVVGHELAHGVTDFSSHLFYFYQSGAINESLSDVWGEFIDQGNGSGTDTLPVKWQIGEDLPVIGAIRNMQDPTQSPFNHPDKMSSIFYQCDSSDNGGVHANSGVNNKAAYLMVDGGTFNGSTVTGMGISKVADLYYEVQTAMLTSGSNYSDLYDALIQAGVNLGYSASERQEILDALNAVEMNQRPCAGSPEAPICPTGQSPTLYLFFDDLEVTASGNWTSAANSGLNTWYYPQTTNPLDFDATYASSGVYNLWGYNQESTADFYIAMTADVTLTPGAYMHFRHDWAFENDGSGSNYDGGVVEYSSNGGSTWNDAGSLFVNNGYNGSIEDAFDNPLGGRQAFVAAGQGYTASRLDLNSLAGQNVRFRFRIGTDSAIDDSGWFIDDVGIYTCAAGNATPRFLSSGPPAQFLSSGASRDNAIDLWKYVADYEDTDDRLTFSLCNTPDPNAGVTIDSNRYIDLATTAGWIDSTAVCVRATDTGSATGDTLFSVSTRRVYLPLVLK